MQGIFEKDLVMKNLMQRGCLLDKCIVGEAGVDRIIFAWELQQKKRKRKVHYYCV